MSGEKGGDGSAGRRARPAITLVVLVVCVTALMLTVGIPAPASAHAAGTRAGANGGHHTIVVLPTGSDDTARIQAAFNTCTSHGWTCTIQLVKGTYHTSQIAVTGFQGSFVGAGQGSTVVLGNPNLASPTADPFWSALPGPENPWPAIFTFVNGNFWMSGMTISDTHFYPTMGWDWPGVGTVTALWSWVLITGTQAYVSISHLTAIGGSGDQGPYPGNSDTFNNINGITFEGMLLPNGYEDVYADQIPLSGSFSLTSSTLQWAATAVWVENVLEATATICFNSIQTAGTGFWDISASQLRYCGNVVTNVVSEDVLGIYGIQSMHKTNLLPSTVSVVGNYFAVNTGGGGLGFFDLGPADGVASTLSVVVTGNTVVADTTCATCWPDGSIVGILGYALVNFVASYNVVTASPNAVGFGIGVNNYYGGVGTGGGAIVGNYVTGVNNSTSLVGANGFSVVGNTIKNSGAYGIMVWYGSSNIVVAYNLVKNSGVDDLYWDQTGSNDLWYGNIYATSNPATLP